MTSQNTPDTTVKVNTILEKLYYNTSQPVSYAGVQPITVYSKNNVSPESVKNWISGQDTYTLFKPVRRKFKRNSYLVSNINDLWQSDLVDLQSLKEHNDGVNYLLTTIDVFSKKAFVQPLKSKKGEAIIAAYREIFTIANTKPINLQTDKGKEFVAKNVQKFFKENQINHFTTQNPDVKAAVVERFNRTLKTRMWRYLHHENTLKYADVLQDFVSSYNNSFHRTIKMTPNEVDESKIKQVYRNTYCDENAFSSSVSERKPKLKVDDYVRLVKQKGTFEKGYETNFTEEVFKIKKVIKHKIPVYEVVDLADEIIEGTFYEPELQKISFNPDTAFKIDKIVRTKGKGPSKQMLVKWKGYPDKFNSWVFENDLVSL